jgi:acyl-CoA synthetase (AMP-forming)/AMP-acid ligase II
MNPAMTTTELISLVQELRIDGILVGEGLTDNLRMAAEQSGASLIPVTSTGKTGLFEVPTGNAPQPGNSDMPGPGDVAILLRTSGTTSAPKIVPQTNSNRYATLTRVRKDMSIDSSDRCLNLMPLHHTQGVNAEFLAPLTNGASVAFELFDAGNIVNQVAKHRPTWFNLVPSMHQAVLSALGDAEAVLAGYDLRFSRSSSAKLDPSLRKRLERAYGVPIIESYGSSETSNIASTGLSASDTREGSVGKPDFHDIKITDLAGNELPAGEQGEICVSGPSVISGYENNPTANAEQFRGNWYRTGDEGYFDNDGFLYITGRTHEIVNRGGEKFSISEIDNVLLSTPGVETGAAFTAPHEKLGHEIYAAVVASPESQVSPASIRSELANHLSWSRVPKQIFVVTEIPVNSIGKVMRDVLAESLVSSE